MTMITDLPTDDMPFINAKIDKALIDFETTVDYLTTIQHNTRSVVRGFVTD